MYTVQVYTGLSAARFICRQPALIHDAIKKDAGPFGLTSFFLENESVSQMAWEGKLKKR